MKNFLRKFGSKYANLSTDASGGSKPLFRWIIDRQLAVGPIPDHALYQQLVNAEFKSVLTLCDEPEGNVNPNVPVHFHWQRLVLPDSHYIEPLKAEQLGAAVEIVAQNIAQAAPVYVHCLAGMERSPSVCIAYLCLYQDMAVWEALNWVKQHNPRTSLNQHQVQAIHALVGQKPLPAKQN